jgi:hypothetical protein
MQDAAWRDDEEVQDVGAWGLSRVPPMMLSLRFMDGNRRSFSYAELVGTEYKKDVLTLYFYQATVRIRGRDMEKLADTIERHGVRFIREQHLSPFEANGGQGQIERIEIAPPALEKLQERRAG